MTDRASGNCPDMAWSFRQEAKIGAETALDACDYFVDDVLDVWQASGVADFRRIRVEMENQ